MILLSPTGPQGPQLSGLQINRSHKHLSVIKQSRKEIEFLMTMAAAMSSPTDDHHYDRLKDVKPFDDSKLGVKGLVDSGITSIPPFFIQPPESILAAKKPITRPDPEIIPTIDLSGADSEKRSDLVEQISRASRQFGFFQIVNHGVPEEVLDRAIDGIKRFHELPTEVKAWWHRRETGTRVAYFTKFDLFHSKAPIWRDTLQMRLGPSLPELEEIPQVCRNELLEWNLQTKRVAVLLMELLCEGLGLNSGKLKDATCLESRAMVGQYYPYCPQPDLTVGITSHTDPGVLTVLVQDHVGGLQVKYDEKWVDVEPVRGALVINIGDILQIMSNDEYKSVEHRVLANRCREPRISIAVFFTPSNKDSLYGPFPELISQQKPAIYQHFNVVDYMRRFFAKELDGKSLKNYYKL